MPVLGVIPARLGSTRLERKPLQLLRGTPLVVRVWDRVRELGVVDEVVVATDAPEVAAAVARSGGRTVMTSSLHESGTERVAEVVSRPEFAGFDLVLNVQGDEPFLPLEAARGALERVRAGDEIGTAAAPLDREAASDPARVKVVLDARGRALYFSRARIPFPREPGSPDALYWQHLGVYAYTGETLARWLRLPPTALERAERLEQLRPLVHGLAIGVATIDRQVAPGIDTPDDLAQADTLWDAFSMGE